jgi:hypothetical protein
MLNSNRTTADGLVVYGTTEKLLIQQDHMHRLGLMRVVMEGDGNCAPRAISTAIFSTPDYHQEIRDAAVHWLIANLAECMRMMDFDFEDDVQQEFTCMLRLSNLRTRGTWADHILLWGLAGANDLTINCISGNGDGLKDTLSVGTGATQAYMLYMTDDKGEGLHFDLAIPDPSLAVQVNSSVQLYELLSAIDINKYVPLSHKHGSMLFPHHESYSVTSLIISQTPSIYLLRTLRISHFVFPIIYS